MSKGPDIVIRSFADAHKVEKRLSLWIGGRGADLPKLQKMAFDLGVDKSVKFTGFVPDSDLREFYSQAAIMVFPTRLGFALQLLEAMACGTPVITSDTTDKREVLRKGALFLTDNSTDLLTSAILKATGDSPFALGLRKDAYEQSLEYSWERMAIETCKVYNNFIST